MMKKKSILTIIIVLIALIASISLVACSSDTPAEEQQDAELVLTLEELSEFDGQDGNRAYVAVDGVIYDVTDSEHWENGAHKGFTAGKDLTKEIKEDSPHGISKLENVIEVGTLAE